MKQLFVSLFGKFGKQFDYQFAPMSFTIIRIHAKKQK